MKFDSSMFESSGGVSGKDFIKIEPDTRVMGVFIGDEEVFKTHWINNRSVRCSLDSSCPHCAGGDKPKSRFRVNFITKVNGALTSKIFESGYGAYTSLLSIQKQLGTDRFNRSTFSISRSGSGTKTTYTFLPLDQLDDAALAKLNEIPLIPLGNQEPPTFETQDDEFNFKDDTTPF